MQKHNSKPKLHKQAPFDLHLNIAPKDNQYNALTDPHASYFFVSKVAKERLKDLKLQLKRENKFKSPAKKEMIRAINHKIKFEFPKIKLPLLQGTNTDEKQISKDQRKLSHPIKNHQLSERNRELSNKSSLKHFSRQQAYEIEFPVAQGLKTSQEAKLRKSSKRVKVKAEKKDKDKNKVNHEEFLQFLSKKKEQVASKTEGQVS